MTELRERAFDVPASGVSLKARLVQPQSPKGVVVVFASSEEGAEVATTLGQLSSQEMPARALSALRLTPTAADEQQHRVSSHIMADRLIAAVFWIVREQSLYGLPVGLFGVEQTTTAVLVAAAALSEVVRCLVVAGDCPRLRADVLMQIEAPTLLIAPARDATALAHHQATLAHLHVEKKLDVLEGFGSLAEGMAMTRVVRLATRWFDRHLGIDERLLGHPSTVRPHH